MSSITWYKLHQPSIQKTNNKNLIIRKTLLCNDEFQCKIFTYICTNIYEIIYQLISVICLNSILIQKMQITLQPEYFQENILLYKQLKMLYFFVPEIR